MGKDMFWTTVTFGIIIGVLCLAFWPADKHHVTVKYDCRRIAEGSPDIPLEVKEQCKKLRSK